MPGWSPEGTRNPHQPQPPRSFVALRGVAPVADLRWAQPVHAGTTGTTRPREPGARNDGIPP